MRNARLWVLFLVAGLISGCGQKGPLVLPDTPKHKKVAPRANAPAAPAPQQGAPATPATTPAATAAPATTPAADAAGDPLDTIQKP